MARVGKLVEVSEEGLVFRLPAKEKRQSEPRSSQRMGWEVIERVEVFKRDLFSVDLICVQFTCYHGEEIEIDEEDGHWERVIGMLPECLPGCLDWRTWFSKVAFPAFETNRRVVFERSAQKN